MPAMFAHSIESASLLRFFPLPLVEHLERPGLMERREIRPRSWADCDADVVVDSAGDAITGRQETVDRGILY